MRDLNLVETSREAKPFGQAQRIFSLKTTQEVVTDRASAGLGLVLVNKVAVTFCYNSSLLS